jgi:hypothetical protein
VHVNLRPQNARYVTAAEAEEIIARTSLVFARRPPGALMKPASEPATQWTRDSSGSANGFPVWTYGALTRTLVC